jgi:hypothetical protein
VIIRRGGAVQALLRGTNSVTEYGDVIRALWNALPEQCRTGYYRLHKSRTEVFYVKRFQANIGQMSSDVYRCFGDMNMSEAVKNLISNEIEDRLFGRLGKVGGEAGRRTGRPAGIQTGPWDTIGVESFLEHRLQQRREKNERERRRRLAKKKAKQKHG